jgi:dipeptidyl aminopeptidase/acylaminoacyl peptidase
MLTVRSIPLVLLCLYFYTNAWPQQKLISNDTYRTWAQLYTDYGLSDDGSYLWYRYGSPNSGDVLVLRTVNDSIHQEFPRAFHPIMENHYFFFQLPDDTLVIYTPENTTYFPNVINYQLQDNQLIIQKKEALEWYDLNTGLHKTILTGAPSRQIVFNGSQLAFLAENTLQYYRQDMDTPQVLLRINTGAFRFSRDGKSIFFDQLPATTPKQEERLRLWHYKDQFLEPTPLRYTTVILHLEDGHIIPLNDSNTITSYQQGGRYIITQNILNNQEYYWNKRGISTLYLVDTHTGEKKTIATNKTGLLLHAAISPQEKFVTWYDANTEYYSCYEIATGNIHLLLKGERIAQWAPGDSAVFIHTTEHIWQADPTGNNPPVNITPRQHIIFRMLFPGVFSAFNTITKENGFWKWDGSQLTPCTMDHYLYYTPQYPLDQYKPVKAKDTSVYLVQRMNSSTAPNLFITTDFRTFSPVTHFAPQAAYNWLTVTLTKEGLLYRPADFDPKKRYPVIFHYYEKSSDYLHRYLPPALSDGRLDIAWYVSNGYIVFMPDIRTKKGHTGKSAAHAVIRAAKYLAAFPWVDQQKMGLQGHSFGGYITNYIITHSHLFAAAQESAGPTDFLSGYGALRKYSGTSMQQLYEQGQNNIGATPWERPAFYLKNSPVLRAHKVNTPLLMMHNENDNAVPFAQAIEFFTALRRLQKPVWLLQYKDEGHQLSLDADKLDFSIRQQQFFDYYLKGKPMPEWMRDH